MKKDYFLWEEKVFTMWAENVNFSTRSRYVWGYCWKCSGKVSAFTKKCCKIFTLLVEGSQKLFHRIMLFFNIIIFLLLRIVYCLTTACRYVCQLFFCILLRISPSPSPLVRDSLSYYAMVTFFLTKMKNTKKCR